MLNIFVTQSPFGKQLLNASFKTGDVVAMALTGTNGGQPLDLTGQLIKMTIGFEEPLELSTTNGLIVITNPTAGQFTVNMSSTMTAAFIPGVYPYDLWIQSQISPPIETAYFGGNIYVNQSVTAVP